MLRAIAPREAKAIFAALARRPAGDLDCARLDDLVSVLSKRDPFFVAVVQSIVMEARLDAVEKGIEERLQRLENARERLLVSSNKLIGQTATRTAEWTAGRLVDRFGKSLLSVSVFNFRAAALVTFAALVLGIFGRETFMPTPAIFSNLQCTQNDDAGDQLCLWKDAAGKHWRARLAKPEEVK